MIYGGDRRILPAIRERCLCAPKPANRFAEKILRTRVMIRAQSTYAHALPQDDWFASVAAEGLATPSKGDAPIAGTGPAEGSGSPPVCSCPPIDGRFTRG